MKAKAIQTSFLDVNLPDHEVKRIVYDVLEDMYGFRHECYVKDDHIWYGYSDNRYCDPVRVASATEDNRRAIEVYSLLYKYWQNKKVY